VFFKTDRCRQNLTEPRVRFIPKGLLVRIFNDLAEIRESVSGPGGRRFGSSRPDHSLKRALSKIICKGFLYVGVTLMASTEQSEDTIRNNLMF
jgi:hypothetical protein